MTKKSHKTIAKDIMELLSSPHEVNEDNLEWFLEDLKECFKDYFKHEHKGDGNHLRLSGYGNPPRKLWYTLNRDWEPKPQTRIKFLFGHIIESLVLFLVKESGHEVTHEQHKADFKGIKGSMDCIIDGVVYDVKGLSSFGAAKFKSGKILNKGMDSFNYLPQIGGYFESAKAEGITKSNEMGFLVLDKITGNITNFIMDDMEVPNVHKIADKAIEVAALEEPPEEKCYELKVHDNGNKELSTNCGYCPFKDECWADANGGKGLRKFKYANGVKYLVHIEEGKEPRVDEITENKDDTKK